MTRPLALSVLCRPTPERPDALAVQVYRDLLEAIRDGRLAPEVRLPSSRAAAAELDLSRGTVNTAYDLLRAEGVLEIRRGAAPRIVSVPAAAAPAPGRTALVPSARGARLAENPRSRIAGQAGGQMAPGEPSERLFPADEWARALRRAGRRTYGGPATYAELHGVAELRHVLAERLARDRGLRADPERILITTGTQSALALAAHVLGDPGDLAAMEDPGYLGARTALRGAGLEIAPLPVDDEGARAEAVPPGTRLVYLTPSNQYPLGLRLSRGRRMAFLARAREIGAAILEDDYDSEFLWRGREIAALAAEAEGGQVIHIGSVSKVLLPSLRLGWMVVPQGLISPFRVAQRHLGLLANLHAQVALADMMRTGRYRAQLGRISRVYETRGRALARALSRIDGISMRAPDGGVQIAARFDRRISETAAITALAAHGFRPSPLSLYCQAAGDRGLVIGFADATPERIAAFAAILRDVGPDSG